MSLILCLSPRVHSCVNVLGVAERQTTLYVIAADLGAAMGPMVGYAVLQLNMPPSSILCIQMLLHGVAAGVSCTFACTSAQPRGLQQLHDASEEMKATRTAVADADEEEEDNDKA